MSRTNTGSENLGSANSAFSQATWDRAVELAKAYSVVLQQVDGGYEGRVPEFSGLKARGADPNSCEIDTRQALVINVATLLELSRPLPAPKSDRRIQVNIRLTAEEKAAFDAFRKSRGELNMSDCVRSLALIGLRVQNASAGL